MAERGYDCYVTIRVFVVAENDDRAAEEASLMRHEGEVVNVDVDEILPDPDERGDAMRNGDFDNDFKP